MRHTLKAVGTIAAVAALALTGTAATGTAEARPVQAAAGLYAPSALVLGIARGEGPETATVERAVTLNCAPRAGGSHPAPRAACAELRVAEGRFGELTESGSGQLCTREWDPVVVTADGVWEGRHVSWSASFGNPCELRASLGEGVVFAF